MASGTPGGDGGAPPAAPVPAPAAAPVPPPSAAASPFQGPAGAVAAVVVGMTLMTLSLRSAATVVPPLLDPISDDLRLSATLAGLLGSLPTAAFAVAGAFGAPFLRRWHAERLAVALLLTAAACQLLRPLTPVPVFFTLSFLSLLACGLGNVLLPVVVKTWFPRHIGLVTALYVTGVSAGAALAPLVAVPLADSAARDGGAPGWHRALMVWGLVAAVAALPWVVPSRHPRTPVSRAGTPHSPVPVQRSRTAWGVMLVFGVTSLNFYSLVSWLPQRLVDAGLTEVKAGAELSLLAAVGLPLALAMPPLTARIRSPFPLVVASAVLSFLGYLGLLLAPDRLTTLWVLVAGAGAGGFPMALALVGLRSGSPQTAGSLSAFAQGLGYAMAWPGPVVVGALHGRTGGWSAPFLFLMASLSLLVLGGRLVAGRRTVEDDLRPAPKGGEPVGRAPA